VRVLIYGCGQLASSMVRMLLEDATEITVLGEEQSQLERLSSYANVSAVLLEEPIMHDYMMEAGISKADTFLALSHDDHDNLLAAQIAKRMFGVPTVVCHVENPQLQVFYGQWDLNVISYSVGVLQDIHYVISSR
jgi:trk system potassium uptake protein TrkA